MKDFFKVYEILYKIDSKVIHVQHVYVIEKLVTNQTHIDKRGA